MTPSLHELLSDYLKSLEDFNTLLERERSYIESNQLDDYAQLMKAKEHLVQAVSKQYQALTAIAGPQGVEPYILQQSKSSDKAAKDLIRLWKQIKENTLQLEHQNQVNGMLIIASKNITEKLLDLMTGRQKGVYSKHAKAIHEIESTKSRRI